MNSNFIQPDWSRLRGFMFLIIVILALGMFFRCINLDKKGYWHDEVYTSLRISGYTRVKVIKQVFNGEVIGVKDLQKYQYPNTEKSLIDVTKSLAVEEAQHPPLYFILGRFWLQTWGDSMAVIRGLSAFISLLVFPCAYLLCRELFESQVITWMAIILIAVSPFQVVYAQVAREYSLWVVTILLSSWALLRAIRLQTKLSWVIYTATLALSLYSFLFSVLVAIGHEIYVLGIEGWRILSVRQTRYWSKTLTAYLLASIAGFLAFTPWLLVIVTNLSAVQNQTGHLNGRQPLLSMVKNLTMPLINIFLDADSKGGLLDFGFRNIFTDLIRLILVLITLVVTGYSIYFLCRHAPKRVWLFILTLIGVTPLALILPDLILGGSRSAVPRYLTPCYLGIHLAVAYLLATQIFSANLFQRKIWQVVTAVMISMGVISLVTISQAENWYTMPFSKTNPPIARIINKANHPLLICNNLDINFGNVIAMSYLLAPKVRLQLVADSHVPKIPEGFSDVFLLKPSDTLRFGIEKEQNSKAEIAYEQKADNASDIWLWKLAKQRLISN